MVVVHVKLAVFTARLVRLADRAPIPLCTKQHVVFGGCHSVLLSQRRLAPVFLAAFATKPGEPFFVHGSIFVSVHSHVRASRGVLAIPALCHRRTRAVLFGIHAQAEFAFILVLETFRAALHATSKENAAPPRRQAARRR